MNRNSAREYVSRLRGKQTFWRAFSPSWLLSSILWNYAFKCMIIISLGQTSSIFFLLFLIISPPPTRTVTLLTPRRRRLSARGSMWPSRSPGNRGPWASWTACAPASVVGRPFCLVVSFLDCFFLQSCELLLGKCLTSLALLAGLCLPRSFSVVGYCFECLWVFGSFSKNIVDKKNIF